MIKKETNKNGLVELFRFLCSLWVAYFHGFSPILSDKFDGVNISIDFFFMVSGLFFLRTLEKLKDKPFLQATKSILWGRIGKIIVPLCIAALSVLFCNIFFEMEFDGFNWPFSFLWFFGAQFVFLSLYYLLYKNVKRLSSFNIICVIILFATMSLCILKNETFGRVARGPGMIALGMLISQIPKIKIELNDQRKAERLTLWLNIIGFSISAIAFAIFAYLPTFAIWKLHIFICIICPSLLYFATAIPVRSRFLNLLGEFSAFVYLAQCPILIHHYYVSKDTKDQFYLLCICAVAMFVINRIVNRKKVKI